jgi:hypothetical protein
MEVLWKRFVIDTFKAINVRISGLERKNVVLNGRRHLGHRRSVGGVERRSEVDATARASSNVG